MKKSLKYLAVLLTCLFCTLVYADTSDPVNMLQSVADQLIQELKANRVTIKSNRSLVYSLANRIVVPHADIDQMAMRVMPPNVWNNSTSAQKTQFKHEFTTLLVRTYASALANYEDQTIKFYPVRGGYAGKSTVRVTSKIIRSDGPPISVDYRLVKEGSSWWLFDMTVEGVSLLESFRSQFADKLNSGDMNALIRELQRHNHGGNG